MARRSSSRRGDSGMGCLGLIIGLPLLLITTGSDTEKKVGWGIVGVLCFLLILFEAGVSGEDAAIILIVIAAIVFIALIVFAFANDTSKTTNNKIEQKPVVEVKPSVNASVKRTQNVNTTAKGTQSANTPANAISDVKAVTVEPFEKQFAKMKKQVEAVCGDKVKTAEPVHSEKIEELEPTHEEKVRKHDERKKIEFFDSVEEAINSVEVPSGYKKIMIECIQQTDIKECPGLIWKDEETLYVLPLARDAQIYSWPLTSVPIIMYEERNNPDMDEEYMDVSLQKIAEEFEGVFPEYPFGKKGVYTGKFILPIGLEVTNTSGKVLFELLSAKFHVVDDITQSTWYAKEIKELYQRKILRDTGVISYEQYSEERERFISTYLTSEKDEKRYAEQMQAAKKLELL